MTDIIVILLIVVVLGSGVLYLITEKKKGTKCIGCPHSKTCGTETITAISR